MEEKQLTLFVADSPVKMYPSQGDALVSLVNALACGSSLPESLTKLNRDGSLSKTSLVFYPAIKDKTLPPSFNGWRSAGMVLPGGCLTFSFSEFPNEGGACSLSQVLETEAPPKYYLSPKAAKGIIQRAEKRGKKLPTHLEQTLRTVAIRETAE